VTLFSVSLPNPRQHPLTVSVLRNSSVSSAIAEAVGPSLAYLLWMCRYFERYLSMLVAGGEIPEGRRVIPYLRILEVGRADN
jgi:hypothetical protein